MDIEPLQHAFYLFMISSARIAAVFTIMPFLSKQTMGTTMIRNGVVASLALYLYPIVSHEYASFALSTGDTVIILIKEAFIGLLIGFLITLPFWAIESVGFFIDNQRGATMASSLNPLSGSQTSPLGILLTQGLVTLFFISGAFMLFLHALYNSYLLWPIFSFFPTFSTDAPRFFLSQLDTLMRLTVLLGGPVVLAMFLSEFGLALISRFAPQLNVFILSMPIKSAVAIAIMIVYVPLVLHYFSDYLSDPSALLSSLIPLLQ
jgi:type III secretion protein T